MSGRVIANNKARGKQSEQRHSTERSSINERANKLMIRMRNFTVKRPKCRSKSVMIASVASASLLIVGVLVVYARISAESTEKIYGGEWINKDFQEFFSSHVSEISISE